MIGGHFPAWALTLILGVALAVLVFLTSKNEEPPKYHAVSILFFHIQGSLGVGVLGCT